jgi:hypothetical protein
MPVAATASDWVALLAIAVLLGLAGYAVIRLNRRQVTEQRVWREAVGAVPPELRFQPEPPRLRTAAIALIAIAAVVGNTLSGEWGALAGVAIVLAPFYAVALRRRKRHRAEVIAAVERRADDMSQEELRRLVEGLELSHGRAEMRPLRRLADGS